MKRLYWRPQRTSLRVLALLAAISVGGLISVEAFLVREQQPHYKAKMAAAHLARRSFDVVKDEMERLRIPIDQETDPSRSGLIGLLLSPVTTNPGHLPAKQTAANPNFAAVVVHLLKRAGVEEGDTVAVGLSGSFPAINLCVYAALETLKVRPVVVSSVGSSQWGANRPNFMWPDIERLMFEKRLFSFRAMAVSRGGIDDRALGLSRHGRALLDKAADRLSLPRLEVSNYGESVEKRMALYREQAGDGEIAAYINVGGGTSSVGTRVGKKMFKPGLNRKLPRGVPDIDSVMTRFMLEGVPVIHMSSIDRLAQRYGLPLQPTTMPPTGQGTTFFREEYNIWLAIAVLGAILLVAIAFVRLDWGYRLLTSGKRDAGTVRPEETV